MAEPSAETPFLADNEHDEDNEQHYESNGALPKEASANACFKKAIKILNLVISLLSIYVFGLLIAVYVLIRTGPFSNTYDSTQFVRDLSIVLFTNFVLTTPQIFFSIPILLTMATNIALSIPILVFSSHIFGDEWPSSGFCYRYNYTPGGRYETLPETWECRQARNKVRICMAVSAGVGLLIGIIILSVLLLRLIALARSKFWENKAKVFASMGWKPRGFTIQFSLSVLPHGAPVVRHEGSHQGGEEGGLIETEV